MIFPTRCHVFASLKYVLFYSTNCLLNCDEFCFAFNVFICGITFFYNKFLKIQYLYLYLCDRDYIVFCNFIYIFVHVQSTSLTLLKFPSNLTEIRSLFGFRMSRRVIFVETTLRVTCE